MAALSLEQFLDVHPMAAWNRDTWDQRDEAVDTRFHESDIHFTPMSDYVAFPTGVGLNQKWYTGRQIVQANANHNELGWYQRFTDSIYVDLRERSLQSRKRYGGKSQYDKFDELVTRFGNDSDSFISAVMQQQLLNNVVVVHEKIARDATLNFAQNKFLGNKSTFSATNNLSTLDGSGDFMFDITYLDEMARRFMVRSMETRRKYGDYANPVPGENFRSNVLVMVPSLVYADIWESPARDWLVDLRQLDDKRIINSAQPALQYRNITIADYGMELSLWNAGRILKQVSVTEPISWGDGAPDPELETVDGIWYTGQAGANVKHYIQVTPASFVAADYPVGDMIAVHVKKTNAWGVTNGVDITDGLTIMCEVHSTDPTAGKIVVRVPVTEQYDKAVEPGVFAYVTRAQHVYPVYTIGARGYMKWAGREKITWHKPTDLEADYPSIVRVTWQERGEMNPWALDDYEIVFCEAKYAARHGGVSIR